MVCFLSFDINDDSNERSGVARRVLRWVIAFSCKVGGIMLNACDIYNPYAIECISAISPLMQMRCDQIAALTIGASSS